MILLIHFSTDAEMKLDNATTWPKVGEFLEYAYKTYEVFRVTHSFQGPHTIRILSKEVG